MFANYGVHDHPAVMSEVVHFDRMDIVNWLHVRGFS
jgi:hypothetical protein